MKTVLAAAVAVACMGCTPTENAASDRDVTVAVDAYMASLVQSQEFAGVVLIADGDNVLVSRSYGLADVEANDRHRIDSVFGIASLSKTFTAGAIELLGQRGALSLSDPLSLYAPDFPNGDAITIEMLLLHQSGVMEEYQFADFAERKLEPITLAEQVARIGAHPLEFEPGTDGSYSNSGYVILAHIVEVVSQQPFEEFLRNEFFEPLAMSDTGVDWPGDNVARRATPYVPGRPPAMLEAAAREAHASHQLGASELRSTSMDLLSWLRAVNAGEIVDVWALDYPYGWGVREYHGRREIEQSGISSGFVSAIAIYPDDDLYVVVLSNIRAGRPQANVHIDVAGLAFGEEVELLAARTYVFGGGDLSGYAGRYSFPGVGPIAITPAGEVLRFDWEGFDLRSYLYPLGDGVFWNALDGAEISFESGDDGKPAPALIWAPGEHQTRAPRLGE